VHTSSLRLGDVIYRQQWFLWLTSPPVEDLGRSPNPPCGRRDRWIRIRHGTWGVDSPAVILTTNSPLLFDAVRIPSNELTYLAAWRWRLSSISRSSRHTAETVSPTPVTGDRSVAFHLGTDAFCAGSSDFDASNRVVCAMLFELLMATKDTSVSNLLDDGRHRDSHGFVESTYIVAND